MTSKHSLVPANIEQLKPYVPGKTIAEVVEEYQPDQISKLASNENRVGFSKHVYPAIQEALSYAHEYPDPLTKKLTKEIANENGVDQSQVIFGAGSESVLSMLCKTFFLNKQNIVTSNATFIGMYVQAQIRGVKVKKTPLTREYKFDVKALVNAIDDDTKMVYIANPNNPTGTYITTEEFEWLMEHIPSDVMVIMDEAYYEYTYEVNDYPDVLSYNYENVVVLRTFSKGYGLAGFRIGYAIASKEIIGYLYKTKMPFEPTVIAQAAALAAFKDIEFLKNSRSIVKQEKEKLYDFFDQKRVQYIPSIANFVVMVFETEEEAIFFTSTMLKKGVILRRIQAFGLPTCVRVTIGTEKEMEHFKRSFSEVLNR
ncbi:MAG: histidinol-phosphate transaminase [Balneola sp.]|nr:MAG: histidinol-phosphate transaminase [Balneola sp.]